MEAIRERGKEIARALATAALLLAAAPAPAQLGVRQTQINPQAAAARAGMETDSNRPGSDYRSFDAPNAQLCQAACTNEAACRAWTWVKPGVQGPSGKCWLKNAVPAPSANACCVSGTKTQQPQTAIVRTPSPSSGKAPIQPTAKLTGPVRVENPRAKQDRQRFADSVRRQNALAAATRNAVLSERGAESMVQQGIIKPEVYTINRERPAGYVFRPGAAFTVVGRGFGKSGVLRLIGVFRNPVPIVQTEWRPNWILASLGPDISGEFDVSNVRLEILALGATEPIVVPNLRFEAARDEVLLRDIPQRYVGLSGWPARYTTNGQSQAPGEYSEFLKANKLQSAIVTRENIGREPKEWFAPGRDVFQLGLNAAFKISRVDFEHGTTRTNPSECKGTSGGEYFQGRYAAAIASDGVVNVDWGVWRCHSSQKWAGIAMIPGEDTNGSAYALDIYAVGPRGAYPWNR